MLFLALLVISACNAQAQARPGKWLLEGKAAPDSNWSKSANGFGAQLIVVGDPRAFLEMWSKPETPDIKPAEEVSRGQQFAAVILFVGCKAGSDGNCNALVNYKVIDPDGKVIAERPDQIIWNQKELDKRTTYLGKAILGLRLSDKNPNGTYTIQAVVSDKNAPAEFELTQTIKLK